ncbi:AEC family transporter [Amnibacterium endophyticum]|uniref:AEC family transporter n=1 Tax=Amnibacterium endophyticum TaxID=2109337 RepID=A0ABW4LEZ5_9MICO
MTGVLQGFAVIAVIIGVGFVLGRSGVLGEGGQLVLSRFVFFVAAPSLLFTVVATARPDVLFSAVTAVSALAAIVAATAYALIARLLWRRPVASVTVGALSSGYVNANNIGLPVAVYVLGSPAYTAPVILLQLAVFAPAALVVLDASTATGRRTARAAVLASLRNPLIGAALLGLVVAVGRVPVPPLVLEPLRLLAGASVPLMLVGFGMSLVGARPLAAGEQRREVVLASLMKLLVMPAVALAIGALVLHLDTAALHVAVVLAALPTAQNVLVYATRYGAGVVLARDAGLITTVGALPVLVLASVLLVP